MTLLMTITIIIIINVVIIICMLCIIMVNKEPPGLLRPDICYMLLLLLLLLSLTIMIMIYTYIAISYSQYPTHYVCIDYYHYRGASWPPTTAHDINTRTRYTPIIRKESTRYCMIYTYIYIYINHII